ncbi:MAG: ATP-binding protein [Gammaproteobacteria bacterium]
MMEQRQLNLVKNFSMVSLLAVIVAAILLGWLYRSLAVDELRKQGEISNITLATTMANAIWPQVREVIDIVAEKKQITETDKTYSINVLDQSVKELIEQTNVIKVNIFDTFGKVVYSTSHEQIGQNNKHADFKDKVVAKGVVLSGMNHEPDIQDATVLYSYLPVKSFEDNDVEGVLEIYSNVADTYQRIQQSQYNFILGLIIILALVYFSLFTVVRNAEVVIRKRSEERDGYLHEIESINSDLDEYSRELAVARDQALDASKAKSAFLANMSHELRTPLNAIIGYSEMMAEEMDLEGRESDAGDLTKIKQAGKHLLSVINDILDLSKIEAGHMELHLAELDVKAAIDNIIETITPLAEKGNNKISVNIADDISSMFTDLTRMRQVLLNLLGNACKYTNEGVVELEVKRKADDPDLLVFTVSDSGVGIDAEHLEYIFEAFKQVDSSSTKEVGGTGLGLTISKRFCEMLGGSIHARSRIDEGSEFTVILPERSSHSTGKEGKPSERIISAEDVRLSNSKDDERRNRVSKVLVIDDDVAVSDLIDRTLSAEGFEINVINNASEAIDEAKAWHPDVVLLDVMMPKVDGWAVLKELKEDSELGIVPVIMMTVVDNYEMADALGADGFVVKPINRKKLKKAITLCLRTTRVEHKEENIVA